MSQSGAPAIDIVALDRAEIRFEARSWPFAADRREAIDRHFALLQQQRSDVWNGRVLLLGRHAVDGNVLHGTCFEADYASFSAWRDWGCPDANVHNVFAAAALRSADGAFLVGKMAPATAAAGLMYFPSGTPEPADLDDDGMLDLDGNLGRELREETGIGIGELAAEGGWTMVRYGCQLALLRQVVAREDAAELRARIMKNLSGHERPEFADILVVRSPRDFDRAMPRFVTGFLTHLWSAQP